MVGGEVKVGGKALLLVDVIGYDEHKGKYILDSDEAEWESKSFCQTCGGLEDVVVLSKPEQLEPFRYCAYSLTPEEICSLFFDVENCVFDKSVPLDEVDDNKVLDAIIRCLDDCYGKN